MAAIRAFQKELELGSVWFRNRGLQLLRLIVQKYKSLKKQHKINSSMCLFLSKKLYFICTCLLKNILFWQYMTAKKNEKTFWPTSILLKVSELHVTFFISFKISFLTFWNLRSCPACVSITSQKNVSSKKTLHRRLKRNLSWVFRWKSVDITHHARVRYTNYCIKIAKNCRKKRQQNATKSLENRPKYCLCKLVCTVLVRTVLSNNKSF